MAKKKKKIRAKRRVTKRLHRRVHTGGEVCKFC